MVIFHSRKLSGKDPFYRSIFVYIYTYVKTSINTYLYLIVTSSLEKVLKRCLSRMYTYEKRSINIYIYEKTSINVYLC